VAAGIEGPLKNQGSEKTILESLLHYLSILLKYRWFIIVTTVVAAIGVTAFSIVSLRLPPEKSPLPNYYTTDATILVERGTQGALASTILASLGLERGATTATGYFDIGAFLIMVLRSRTFLDKVIEEFNIIDRYHLAYQAKTKARALLDSKTGIDYDRTTASIMISFQDTDPVFARDVTNRMVSLLNEWYSQNIGSTNMQQKQLLEDKVKEVKAEVGTLERRLKALQNRYGVLTAQDLGTSQASALAELRSQLILKEIEIKNYATVSAIEDPRLVQLREERQNILDLIAAQTGAPNPLGSSTDQRNLPQVQTEFNNLTVELNVQKQIYDTLSQQYEVMKLTSDPEQAFQILELAEVPDAKSGPQRSKIVMVVTLAAFAASVAFALLLNSLSQLRARSAKSVLTKKEIAPKPS
jgi:tyrosine-protein kinase Etk/Wzc